MTFKAGWESAEVQLKRVVVFPYLDNEAGWIRRKCEELNRVDGDVEQLGSDKDIREFIFGYRDMIC